MRTKQRERDAGGKPSAVFTKDELAIAVLGGDSVEAPAVKGGDAVAALASGGASHRWQRPLT